jgi:hypothetical protein
MYAGNLRFFESGNGQMEGGTVNIKIIQHETSVETRVMGYDHMPYSVNPNGAPAAIEHAVRTGFAFNITDFDLRTTEWSENV